MSTQTFRIPRRPNPRLRALRAANALLDPIAFRQWLSSQPTDRVWDLREHDEPFCVWLRETGQAPDATLVHDPTCDFSGSEWGQALLHGVWVEVPGAFFWFYDEAYAWDGKGPGRQRTVAEYRTAWDEMMREHYADWAEYWDATRDLADCGEAVST